MKIRVDGSRRLVYCHSKFSWTFSVKSVNSACLPAFPASRRSTESRNLVLQITWLKRKFLSRLLSLQCSLLFPRWWL